MPFKLQFTTDHAAFEDDAEEVETVRILRNVAERVEAGIWDGAVYDANGNRIGQFSLTP